MSVPVIVVSSKEDHKALVNTALRDSGHAAHCFRIDKPADLAPAMSQHKAELVLIFCSDDQSNIEVACSQLSPSGAPVPLIAVLETADENTIAAAMRAGARDAVSIGNIERLQAVAGRELRTYRIEKALRSVMKSANQYRKELDSLKKISVEAIADIQEGIIVNANPSWLEMFGYQENADLCGTPVMELCGSKDQAALKGGLVACQRGKWQDEVLEIVARKADDTDFSVAFRLENVEFDGEHAVRMLVKAEKAEPATPVHLIEKAMQRDPVTGFYNRPHFFHCAETRLAAPPTGGVRAIVYVRLDRFSRATNDIGFFGTENVITQFSQLLRNFTQKSDIYGRIGGTVFAVVVERGTMTDVEAWSTQLLKLVEDTVFEHEKHSTVLTCSAGICEADGPDVKLQAVLAEAERAGRTARQRGGNSIELSQSSGASKKLRQDDSIWIPRIRGALMENRFRLEHQPVGGLNDEIGDAYDILVRMLDEEGNTILPGEFMPVAERTGLTKNIDRWVIGASLSFSLTSNAELIFIRLSRDSILDELLPAWLAGQLEKCGVTPSRICLEIDEQLAIQHMRHAKQLAGACREIGCRFAIEHFGREPESRQLLNRMPLNFIKIDGSLMQGLHKNPELQDIVRDIALLAREANIQTVAERVQDANTMAVLWQLGISFIQGNYLQSQQIILEDTTTSTITTRALQLSV